MLDQDHLGPDSNARALSRRTLMKASLTVGFCAAVAPVWAQVVTTPADGLVAGEVKVPSGGVDIPAYRAMPDRGGPFATILVVHEVFGVHEYIKDVCRRWAHLGYYAIAPELFARQGDPAKEPDSAKLMADIVNKVPDAEVAADLDASLAFAKASGSADVARAAVTGFCWGGRQVWLYAAHNPTLKAAIAWYGPLQPPTDPTLRPKNPPDIVGELKVPALGLYGGMDRGISAVQIEAMQQKLAAAGGASKIIVYPDAGHAFHADYRPSYNKADAEASWREATAWLKAHGV
ncbi:MAG TPA: dienelactone hydrolase family protein [Roseiarcus sp.]|nr:dienelactone hydrolase family protein [Roseiarcus sp.]